jgi:MFS family permease
MAGLNVKGKRPIFYGWFLIPLCLANITVSSGIANTFSVIFVSLLREYGLSRADLSGVYSLYILVLFCGGVLVGPLLGRIGPRVIIPAGSALIALGLWGCSRISSPYQLFFYYGCITALGCCCIAWLPNSLIITNWFVRRRGMAVGIVMCGAGVATLIFIPLTQFLIDWVGWRGAFLATGLLSVATIAPLNAVFQRSRPEEMGLRPDGVDPESATQRTQSKPKIQEQWKVTHALKTGSFWMMGIAFLFNPFVTFTLTLHQVALVVEQGFSPAAVTTTLGFIGIFAMLGRTSAGTLSDRIGREPAYTLFMAFTSLGILSLFFLSPQKTWMLLAYVVLGGLGQGVGGAMFPAMLADLFPGPRLGKILGILSMFAGLGSSFGSWFLGYLHDLSGSYQWGLVFLFLAVCVAVIAVWIAAPRRALRFD